MQRWERDREIADTEGAFLQRVAEGERPRKISKSRGWPHAKVMEWIAEDEKRAGRYFTALGIAAADIGLDVVQVAKDATPEDVAVRKLRVDAMKWHAERLARNLFGPTIKVERTLSVTADAGLVGFAGDMLRLVSERREKVIDPLNTLRQLPASALPSEFEPAAVEDGYV